MDYDSAIKSVEIAGTVLLIAKMLEQWWPHLWLIKSRTAISDLEDLQQSAHHFSVSSLWVERRFLALFLNAHDAAAYNITHNYIGANRKIDSDFL